jgi:hypothetical protein
MVEINRTIQELLVDYADALRDGSIPVFLKSLTAEEGRRIASSRDYWNAAEMVRVLNGVGFAAKAAVPNVSLFATRVDAEIASRIKKARAPGRGRHSAGRRRATEAEKTEKQI